ncbi:amino acid ABC transporter permease (plasmid) [Ralstonia solanacearum]|uniref:Amino acid ABC transporter permease n=3 Tax=Ralstonia TaxID=48736 RepID=A0AAD0SAC4_RALSL|nr:amino acid ABC transporter permease [Ralstonia solanacearum]QUP55833.1 ABC transporter permease subunit [Ralstonia syzygii]AXV83758.1 amino acid ABC transporter permease [Ralstonia solanacearum]AXV88543.1 amino acid ABC transporter permease [Ralstonia solanacearum]AXV93157.1 amino acid ABC transporter permease [Ralstonia solanacearum]
MMDLIDIVHDNWLLLLVGQYPNGPLGGIACTLILSVLGIVLAFPLSVALALARLSPWRALRAVVTALVYAVRGVPLLMLILWVYFLVPLLIGHNVSGFTTMLCTLAIYEGVYLCEVVRAGIEALPKGQMEAARALGHSYLGAMRLVILPQALYNMLPSMLAQFVSTIKETTLGYVINVPELTFAANQINNALLSKPFQIFFLLAVIYFVVCWSLTRAARALERRIAAKRAGKRRVLTSGTPQPLPVEP